MKRELKVATESVSHVKSSFGSISRVSQGNWVMNALSLGFLNLFEKMNSMHLTYFLMSDYNKEVGMKVSKSIIKHPVIKLNDCHVIIIIEWCLFENGN